MLILSVLKCISQSQEFRQFKTITIVTEFKYDVIDAVEYTCYSCEFTCRLSLSMKSALTRLNKGEPLLDDEKTAFKNLKMCKSNIACYVAENIQPKNSEKAHNLLTYGCQYDIGYNTSVLDNWQISTCKENYCNYQEKYIMLGALCFHCDYRTHDCDNKDNLKKKKCKPLEYCWNQLITVESKLKVEMGCSKYRNVSQNEIICTDDLCNYANSQGRQSIQCYSSNSILDPRTFINDVRKVTCSKCAIIIVYTAFGLYYVQGCATKSNPTYSHTTVEVCDTANCNDKQLLEKFKNKGLKCFECEKNCDISNPILKIVNCNKHCYSAFNWGGSITKQGCKAYEGKLSDHVFCNEYLCNTSPYINRLQERVVKSDTRCIICRESCLENVQTLKSTRCPVDNMGCFVNYAIQKSKLEFVTGCLGSSQKIQKSEVSFEIRNRTCLYSECNSKEYIIEFAPRPSIRCNSCKKYNSRNKCAEIEEIHCYGAAKCMKTFKEERYILSCGYECGSNECCDTNNCNIIDDFLFGGFAKRSTIDCFVCRPSTYKSCTNTKQKQRCTDSRYCFIEYHDNAKILEVGCSNICENLTTVYMNRQCCAEDECNANIPKEIKMHRIIIKHIRASKLSCFNCTLRKNGYCKKIRNYICNTGNSFCVTMISVQTSGNNFEIPMGCAKTCQKNSRKKCCKEKKCNRPNWNKNKIINNKQVNINLQITTARPHISSDTIAIIIICLSTMAILFAAVVLFFLLKNEKIRDNKFIVKASSSLFSGYSNTSVIRSS